jgi:cytochrome o ubiquinol oxidase operon protein cyoD
MHEQSLQEVKKEWHGSLRSYLVGFFVSIILTACSFFLVISKALTSQWLMHGIVGLALLQAIVQLLFFLHLGQEAKPRWETVVFWFMVLVLLIVALGSLWIMHDLDNRVMSGM